MAWELYEDAACTQLFNGTLTTIHKTDLSDNPQDFVLYFANVDDDPGDNQIIKKQEASSPGTNDIVLSIVDSAPSSGHAASEITLGLTSGDLDTNTAGASLGIGDFDSTNGYHLLSGVTARQEIHIRVENAVTAVGTSTELSIEIVATIDSDAAVSSGA